MQSLVQETLTVIKKKEQFQKEKIRADFDVNLR